MNQDDVRANSNGPSNSGSQETPSNLNQPKPSGDIYDKGDIYNKAFVIRLFDEMSRTYGLVNSISSFGFCYIWRVQCARLIPYSPGEVVVDLMSGMSELSITIGKRNPALKHISIDLSPAMCELANRSVSAKKWLSCDVRLADALETGMESNSVDKVVSTFGLKTFTHQQLELLAREIWRILRPGGEIGFLEISVPPFWPLRVLFMFYLRYLIPVIGRIFMGNPENYRLLGIYTGAFRNSDKAAHIFQQVGFEIEKRNFFFGCATGFRGRKPECVSEN